MREKILWGIYFSVLALFIATGYRVSLVRPIATTPPQVVVQKPEPRLAIAVNYIYRCDSIVRYEDGSLVCEIEMSQEELQNGVIGDR